MTMDEINKMIANYESKWGKLGHTNIMNPEKNAIHHSGINKDISQGGNKTMSRMDNELYKFRQKVAAGKEANKLAHKSYISPDELNEMNYEQLMKSRTLIHAQNPLYGQQNPNAKYYKREGQPGKYRYYYTKEEYDAAHKQGNAQTEASKEAQERQQYENNKKAANNNGPSKFNNMRADVVNEYAKIAREASSKDAAKAFYDMAKGGNEAIDELYSTIQDGFKSGKLSYKDGRFETDDDQLREDIEAFSDNIQKFAKQIGEASGKGREIQDELEKLMVPDIEAMNNKNKYSSKISKNKDADDDQKVKEMIRNKADAKSVAKELVKSEKATKYLQGIIKEAQAGNYDFSRRDIDDVDDRDSMDKDTKRGLFDLRDAIEDYIEDELKDLAKAQGKEYKKEFKDNIKDAYYEELLNRFEEMFEVAKKNNPKLGRISKLKEGANKSEAKHSTSGKALITNSAMGDEIMDEYSVFMEKAKRGKEMNRIAHSTFISPEDLNARYEKDLQSQGILVHAGNYKYYNKIDMPNGTTRYFYTKAEWDAYQREKGSKNNTNQKLSEETLKQIEQQKQKKEAYDKNKAAEEAQKKAESDKWDTHKKIREDFHQVPGYMTYSSTFVDDMKATPEGSDKGKDFLFNTMKDAYKKYPKMENIRNSSPKGSQKPKDEEVFGFMDEIQKGIDKYTKDFINKYQLPEQEYTPLINNYFLSMANDLMKENDLDYDYISDVYYRNSDIGKKETKAQEILKQGDFRDHVFPEQLQNMNMIEGLNRSTGQELVEKTEHSETYKGIDRDTDEEYQAALKSFAQTRPAQYIKEEYDNLKNRRTNDGKQQYSDEDIYNAIYKFLHRNVQQWAIKQNDFNPNIFYLIPDLLKTMGIDGKYTADPNDLIIKVK